MLMLYFPGIMEYFTSLLLHWELNYCRNHKYKYGGICNSFSTSAKTQTTKYLNGKFKTFKKCLCKKVIKKLTY